jgi:hypothetical protein
MKVKRAEVLVGSKFRSLIPAYGPRCWLAVRADGIDPHVSYMVENGFITRIDISTSKVGGSSAAIMTPRGIGIGSSRADVEMAYGKSITRSPAPYGHSEGDVWLIVERTRTHGMVVSVINDRVVAFWVGTGRSLGYTEACS